MRCDCNAYYSRVTVSVALAMFIVTYEQEASRLSIICAIPTLIVHHVILIKNIIQLQGAIFERIRNIQIVAHFVENHFVEYDVSLNTTFGRKSLIFFFKVRHSVEYFFFFFFMYDILSKKYFCLFLLCLMAQYLPLTTFIHDIWSKDLAWRIFSGDYRAVLAQTGCWGGKDTCHELCWK